MTDHVLTDVDERTGVARLTLNRPAHRNALNRALVDRLKEELDRAERDDRVRVIGIAGAGPDFCAGADLREVQEAVEAGEAASLADARALGDLFIRIRRLGKPVVALVHGRALAGGAGLATACDLVLATDEARLGYPEVKLGFVPAMVMAILRRSIGEKRAFEMVALGETVEAAEAEKYGLFNRVVPAASFKADATEFLEALASRSASALEMSKRLLYEIDGATFDEAIEAGAQVNVVARLTEDCQAGIRRFLERR